MNLDSICIAVAMSRTARNMWASGVYIIMLCRASNNDIGVSYSVVIVKSNALEARYTFESL